VSAGDQACALITYHTHTHTETVSLPARIQLVVVLAMWSERADWLPVHLLINHPHRQCTVHRAESLAVCLP